MTICHHYDLLKLNQASCSCFVCNHAVPMFIVSACGTQTTVLSEHSDSYEQNVRFTAQQNFAAGGMW